MSETTAVIAAYSTADDVRRLVGQYSRERSPALDDLTVLPSLKWGEAYPEGSAGPGCYAIYGVNGWLVYVGMSVTSVADRLRNHRRLAVQSSWFWTAHPPFTFDVIPVRQRWDAPSLEEYLTCKTTRYKLDRGQTGRPPATASVA